MLRIVNSLKHALLIAATTGALASGASATTLTMDSLAHSIFPPDPLVYQESGFEITPFGSGDLGSFGFGGLHIDICCGPYTSGAQLTRLGGGLFSLLSLDILPFPETAALPTFDHFVTFTGFRGGAIVGVISAGSGDAGTFGFGSGFGLLDRLEIASMYPPSADFFHEDYHYDIDNIVVAPVPLPAAAWLLIAALGVLVPLRMRRRRA